MFNSDVLNDDVGGEYNLKGQVKLIKESIEDETIIGEKINTYCESIIVLPDYNHTEFIMFLDKYKDDYLPFAEDGIIEFICIIKSGLNVPCRISLCEGDRHSELPYFYINSIDVEEKIKKFKIDELHFSILPRKLENNYSV